MASDFGNEGTTEIWPENLRTFEVFEAMCRQWRMGPGGPTGLDYNVLPMIWRLYRVKPKDQRALFDDVRVMESAALGAMARGRE